MGLFDDFGEDDGFTAAGEGGEAVLKLPSGAGVAVFRAFRHGVRLGQLFNGVALMQLNGHRAVAVEVNGGNALSVGGAVADGVVLCFGDDGQGDVGADGFVRTAGGAQTEQEQEG